MRAEVLLGELEDRCGIRERHAADQVGVHLHPIRVELGREHLLERTVHRMSGVRRRHHNVALVQEGVGVCEL